MLALKQVKIRQLGYPYRSKYEVFWNYLSYWKIPALCNISAGNGSIEDVKRAVEEVCSAAVCRFFLPCVRLFFVLRRLRTFGSINAPLCYYKVATETLEPEVWLMGRTKFFGKANINELLNNWLRRRRSTDIQRWGRYACLIKSRVLSFLDAANFVGLRWRGIIRRPKALQIQQLVRALIGVDCLRKRRIRRGHAQTVQRFVCEARALRTWDVLSGALRAAVAARRRGENEAAAVQAAKERSQADHAAAAAAAAAVDGSDSDDEDAYVAEPAYIAHPAPTDGGMHLHSQPQTVVAPYVSPSPQTLRKQFVGVRLSQFQPLRTLRPMGPTLDRGSQGFAVFCRCAGASGTMMTRHTNMMCCSLNLRKYFLFDKVLWRLARV